MQVARGNGERRDDSGGDFFGGVGVKEWKWTG